MFNLLKWHFCAVNPESLQPTTSRAIHISCSYELYHIINLKTPLIWQSDWHTLTSWLEVVVCILIEANIRSSIVLTRGVPYELEPYDLFSLFKITNDLHSSNHIVHNNELLPVNIKNVLLRQIVPIQSNTNMNVNRITRTFTKRTSCLSKWRTS